MSVVVPLAVMVLLVVGWALIVGKREPTEYELRLAAMRAAFEDAATAMGEALLPAVRQATAAMQGFAEAFIEAARGGDDA